MARRYHISYDTQWIFGIVLSFWSKSILLSLFVFVFVTGCTGPTSPSTQLSGTIHVDGSTALLPLVTQAATAFEKQNPMARIIVSGGGSVTGLNDVSNRKVLIGDSDIYASFAAYPNPDMTDHIVCVTPFTLITNPDITLPSLTQAQIVDIFSSNQLTNWQEVGGPNLPIVPIVRPSTSGTRDTFRKYVLGGRDEGTGNQVLQKDSSAAVHDKVAQTPGAIGYLAESVVDNKVHPLAIDGKSATKDNIITGSYTFWSYEHMYTLGDDNPIVAAFLDFMLSPTIQQLAQHDGYIPIGDMKLPQVMRTTGAGTAPTPRLSLVQEREID